MIVKSASIKLFYFFKKRFTLKMFLKRQITQFFEWAKYMNRQFREEKI